MFARGVGQPELVESLHRLVRLAVLSDSSQAGVAAQILLATYNGHDYPMELTELGRLHTELFEDALNAIRLRVQHGIEPHEFYV